MIRSSFSFVKLIICVLIFSFTSLVFAQDGTIYPLDTPNEENAIPLNTGTVENQSAKETWFRQWGDPMARNISTATLTPFLANPEKATGTTIIVAPGGGYRWLSMGNEGWQVAEALAEQGINAFVLKYRLHPTPVDMEDFKDFMERPRPSNDDEDTNQNLLKVDLSNQLEDAEAAYAMIVERAKEWGVNTDKIGMIGFSAGAGLTMHSTLNSTSMKLAFIAPIYGSMKSVDVPKNAPAMFTAIATDDFLFEGDTDVVKSWYKSGIPVELHLYQNGGHGFGLGNPDRTSNRWFEAFMHWMKVNKFHKPKF